MAVRSTKLDPVALRSDLEQQRDNTRERIASLAKRPELGAAQGFGKRIGDGTTEAISRLTEIGVGETLESTLARVERALTKLDEGSYGLCDVCAQPIDPARLQARPDSSLCLSCASSERRNPHPRRR